MFAGGDENLIDKVECLLEEINVSSTKWIERDEYLIGKVERLAGGDECLIDKMECFAGGDEFLIDKMKCLAGEDVCLIDKVD